MAVLLRTLLYGALFVALLSFAAGGILAWPTAGLPATPVVLAISGGLTTIAGASLAFWCAATFVFVGRGTPLPFDPPRRLVVSGPYRVVRNPMALGVGTALVGVGLLFDSLVFLLSVALFMLAIHAMVILYEEPTLQQAFGADYVAYRASVNRWLPRWRPRTAEFSNSAEDATVS